MRRLEASLRPFSECPLEVRLMHEKVAPYCVHWVRRFFVYLAERQGAPPLGVESAAVRDFPTHLVVQRRVGQYAGSGVFRGPVPVSGGTRSGGVRYQESDRDEQRVIESVYRFRSMGGKELLAPLSAEARLSDVNGRLDQIDPLLSEPPRRR